jgi:hypothetical protein
MIVTICGLGCLLAGLGIRWSLTIIRMVRIGVWGWGFIAGIRLLFGRFSKGLLLFMAFSAILLHFRTFSLSLLLFSCLSLYFKAQSLSFAVGPD